MSITNTNATARPASSCSPNRFRAFDKRPPANTDQSRLGNRSRSTSGYALCGLRASDNRLRQSQHAHQRSVLRSVRTGPCAGYIKRINFCYTPKHGSWLNVAECELSCLTSQCLSDRRIGELTELQTEIAAWSEKTNAKQRGVDWQFRIENARIKLKRLYPKIKA